MGPRSAARHRENKSEHTWKGRRQKGHTVWFWEQEAQNQVNLTKGDRSQTPWPEGGAWGGLWASVLFLNLNARCMAVFTLWKFTRRHTHRHVRAFWKWSTHPRKILTLFLFSSLSLVTVKHTEHKIYHLNHLNVRLGSVKYVYLIVQSVTSF